MRTTPPPHPRKALTALPAKRGCFDTYPRTIKIDSLAAISWAHPRFTDLPLRLLKKHFGAVPADTSPYDLGVVLYRDAVRMANPTKMRENIGLKHANDKTDARFIARQLANGILTEGYI